MKLNFYLLVFISALLLLGGCCVPRIVCDPESGNFRYGPEISYRLSSYVGDDVDDDVQSKGSLGVGMFFNWIPCEEYDRLGLRSGLRFEGYGARIDRSYEGIESKVKDRLSYLTVPFTFNYEVVDNFRLELGPDVSFLLGAKQIQEYDGEKNSHSNTELFSKVQLNLNVSASYIHESGVEGFVGYNRGLDKLRSKDYDQNIFNSGVYLGVRYPINKIISRY